MMIDLRRINRAEIIDHNGRKVLYDHRIRKHTKMELSLQDDGQTLKIYLKNNDDDMKRKCIICLRPIPYDEHNEMMSEATIFDTTGTYGSTISDDGKKREIIICDGCLRTSIAAKACKVTSLGE